MQQVARLVKTFENNMGEIEVHRMSACGHDCSTCHGCGAPDEIIHVKAKNLIGAKAGDLVRVESQSGQIIGLAAATYLLPLILFFVCYLVGEKATFLSAGLCGFIGLALGVLVSFGLNRYLTRHNTVVFCITSVVTPYEKD